jgi:hypothetical protein
MEEQQAMQEPSTRVRRRTMLKAAGALGTAVATMNLVDVVAWRPMRQALAQTAGLPDIQFDIGRFIPPAFTVDGVLVQFGPVYTVFATATLSRLPTKAEQTTLANALNTIEANYPFSPSGVFTFVSYGLPYFRRLPGGLSSGSLASTFIPRLANATSRFVLEEAVPSPTDVNSANPGIVKRKFNLPVRIEQNDLLITVRSDDPNKITDVLNWLNRSNRLAGRSIASPVLPWTFTSSRLMFQQRGMPRLVASNNQLYYLDVIQDKSPMWMGFADQQVNSSGPAPIVTFAGNASARLTTAVAGDYFDNGSIQHLSHLILDMLQFFDMATPTSPPGEDGVFTERVQYMFRSPAPSEGNADQFTNGGGPAFIENEFKGVNDARNTAQGIGVEENEHRMGHLSTLQRSSRAADSTPIHIRMDGPGFDNMDVPGGARQPKLQFTVFVPSADFFRTMRRNQASLDLQNQFAVPEEENGLERFLTATRRQNYLIPPRRHRAFPLVEFT